MPEELIEVEQTHSSLFRTDNPVDVIRRATEVADTLADVIRDKNLYVTIQGKPHILHEGWLTLGAMLGVTPVCEWTRPVEKGWEARVEVKTLDGRVIGAAESECLTVEKRWGKADDYAVRSMAQTRASSKALASVLRFVVILRGYSGTPAEEMRPPVEAETKPVEVPAKTQAEIAKLTKLYHQVAPTGSDARKKFGPAKFKAQLAAAVEGETLGEFQTTIEGLK